MAGGGCLPLCGFAASRESLFERRGAEGAEVFCSAPFVLSLSKHVVPQGRGCEGRPALRQAQGERGVWEHRAPCPALVIPAEAGIHGNATQRLGAYVSHTSVHGSRRAPG